MMAACDPGPSVELINRTERSPLKWNLDKFSVADAAGLACGYYLYDLFKEEMRRRGSEAQGG